MKINITRRKFIANMFGGIGIGMAAAGSIPVMSGCGGAVRSTIDGGPIAKENRLSTMDKTATAILYFASLAPSGHNAQPWTVTIVNPGEWIVGSDARRRLPAADADNRALLISIGAFLENLSVAADVFGFETQIEIIAKDAFDQKIARVLLRKSNATTVSEAPLALLSSSASAPLPLKRIKNRRTVRKGFQPSKIKRSDLQALTGNAKENIFYFPRNTKHAGCIEDAQIEAFRVQTKRPEAMQELKNWLRLSDDDAEKYRDGLTPEALDLTGIKGWYIRHFMAPEDMLSDFSINLSIEINEEVVRQGAGWIIVTSESDSAADIIKAGRRYETIALAARERGIAIAPMTQMLEEEIGRDLIGSNHGGRIFPQMVLRVGYLNAYPDPVSLRRPVAFFARSLLLEKQETIGLHPPYA